MVLSSEMISGLGFMAGCLGIIGPIPQIYKIWKNRSAYDLSGPTLLVSYSSTLLWLIYGTLRGDTSLIVSNSFNLLIGCCLAGLKIYYG